MEMPAMFSVRPSIWSRLPYYTPLEKDKKYINGNIIDSGVSRFFLEIIYAFINRRIKRKNGEKKNEMELICCREKRSGRICSEEEKIKEKES